MMYQVKENKSHLVLQQNIYDSYWTKVNIYKSVLLYNKLYMPTQGGHVGRGNGGCNIPLLTS